VAGDIALLVRHMSGDPGAAALGVLSAGERERAARFRFDVHRNRYVARHYWIRLELARRYGGAPQDLIFELGANGKPCLGGAGNRRGGFNVSSSQDYAMLGYDDRGEIGVDIECIRPFRDAADFAAHNYSWSERALAKDPTAFFRIWTRKEAFLKCTGLGLVDDLANLRVGSRNSRRPCRYKDATGKLHVCYLWTWVLDDPLRAISVASFRSLPADLKPETSDP
jgi:phosphopantetheinyl transferase